MTLQRMRNDTPPARRWQYDSRRIYVRPRTGPQSEHLWWPGRPAAGSQRADSLGWDRQADRQTDGSRYRLVPPPRRHHGGGLITGATKLMAVAVLIFNRFSEFFSLSDSPANLQQST